MVERALARPRSPFPSMGARVVAQGAVLGRSRIPWSMDHFVRCAYDSDAMCIATMTR